MPSDGLFRHAYTVCGCLLFALGLIGAFLPLMPTTVFWIGAVMCFARGCPQLEARVLAHPRYGPPIRDFRAHGVICRAGKQAALLSMMVSMAVTLACVESVIGRTGAALVLSTVALWIVTRPEAPAAAASAG